MYKYFFKRLFDFLLALIAITLSLPVLTIVTLILLFANNGKPFFFQKRPGKNEKIFSIIKFKTMNDKKNAHGEFLPDSDRLTKIGSILRKTSLDEIPQIINILIGNMSFIGPRPLLIRYLPYYTEFEKQRHSVKPGITGLAQVSGRNFLDWDTRLKKDVEYVERLSVLLDIHIFIKTIKNVLTSKDVVIDPNSVLQDLDATRKKD